MPGVLLAPDARMRRIETISQNSSPLRAGIFRWGANFCVPAALDSLFNVVGR